MVSHGKRFNTAEGFSLAETLIAILIILLVSAVVAAGLPAAQRAYVNVLEAVDAHMFLSTTMTELRDELSTATEITVPTDNKEKIIYTNPITGKSSISLEEGMFVITSYENLLDAEDAPAVKKERPLVSNAVKTPKLSLDYEFDNEEKKALFTYSDGTVVIAPLIVKSDSNPDSDSGILKLDDSYVIKVIVPEAQWTE